MIMLYIDEFNTIWGWHPNPDGISEDKKTGVLYEGTFEGFESGYVFKFVDGKITKLIETEIQE